MRSNFAQLRGAFAKVGYSPELLEDGSADEAGGAVPYCAGYIRRPRTARNACVAAVETGAVQTIEHVLVKTGAAVALALAGREVTVWRRETNGTHRYEVLPLQSFAALEARARSLLDPRAIHRAKTLGRFDGEYQLDFVDVGLLPKIEKAQGDDLRRLLERIVAALRRPGDSLTPEHGHQVLTIAFWVLAARMLRDHRVPGFVDLKAESKAVLNAVARHYRGAVPVLAGKAGWRERVDAAIDVAWKVAIDFTKVGPEAIAEVHESSLIAHQTRRDLGTHSTPPFLVEYVLGRLRKEILSVPPDRRVVVEPASGHGAFLVAALGVLAEDVPDDASRHSYLRDRLRGLEIDHAAKEMARLSLTLADIPNPDGWDLRDGDMFDGDALARLAQGGTVLLTNPPFEDFDDTERSRLERAMRASGGALADGPVLWNKTAEMLRRTLPALDQDAVIGVIVPRQFLHRSKDETVRRMLLDAFQLLEICVFPDRVFQFSSHECAVILAKGASGGTKHNVPVIYRRVREAGMDDFRAYAKVSTEEVLPGSVFRDSVDKSFAVPELRRLWIARRWAALNDVATVQQGMSYLGSVRKSGHEPVRERAFEGSALGVAGPRNSGNTLITDSLPYVYMDVVKEHIRDVRAGLPTGKPQIVLNTHPHARGPWRLMAYIDPRGAAVPSTRIAVRPRGAKVGVEVLWAICNSLMANAFVYAHLGKRDIKTGTLEGLPIPELSSDACSRLTGMVRDFFAESRKADRDDAFLRDLLRRIDVTLLGAYGLFAPTEQQVLSLFRGYPRPGLPFEASSIGEESRLPQYLGVAGVHPDLPSTSEIGRFTWVADIDAEIDDGRRELAALRRLVGSGDPRIEVRMAYVRAMTRALEEHAAEEWIPDHSAKR
jgi:type I restriction-modification system DNA methylase subunit